MRLRPLPSNAQCDGAAHLDLAARLRILFDHRAVTFDFSLRDRSYGPETSIFENSDGGCFVEADHVRHRYRSSFAVAPNGQNEEKHYRDR